ncbi:MAG: DNA primase [Wenzhouxiangellaceae bacterium]|nr:DNA primase [Wenzhouxiangellaceae bacterium]
MSGLIPESFIENLLERVDIVDVIGSRVPLRPAGHEHKACCPFHDEKTPSFYVSPQKQFYHCFGCGAHGTSIGFVMAYDGLEFPAAIEELAGMAGMEVPREAGAARPDDAGKREREALYAALEAAQNFFRNRLRQNDSAQAYLTGRGFDQPTIDEFGIGLAPKEWSALTDRLLEQGFKPAALERAGLSSRARNDNLIDRFRNRIMFPIHDRRGRVIAFGGRALDDDGPKYLNSAESPVFHKGRELYRLFQARRGGLPERLLVVEGYMDAAALFQFGFEDAVATLGTAVTAEHLELMFRATSVVVFCFDGDAAGRRAAWKGLEAALPVMRSDREVRFLFLPDGEDPDSLVRDRGEQDFRQRLEQATPLSRFLFESLSQKLDMTTPDGRARLVALAEPLLNRLPAGPFAELMAEELNRLAGHSRAWTPLPPVQRAQNQQLSERPLTPVQYAVAILVQHPALAAEVDSERLNAPGDVKGVEFLVQLIDFCTAKPQITTAVILERWRDAPEGRFLSGLATRNLAADSEQLQPALVESLERIQAQLIRSRVGQLQQSQAAGDLSKEQAAELRHWLSKRTTGNSGSNETSK